MWMEAPAVGAPAAQPGFNLSLVVVGLAGLTVLLGILPALITDTTSVVTLALGR